MRIVGDKKTIDYAQKLPPGNKTSYVNWEALEDLPDEFEPVICEVLYDPKNLAADFSDVGNKTFMPSPQLSYKIAEAKGIEGVNSDFEAIYEEVDISLMNMTDVPKYVKLRVGYRCTKVSQVQEEDGTMRKSSVCTIDYNAWNRCVESWTKEESYTDGYSKQGKYPPKYDTKWKRRAHFATEMKFAQQKSETKAHSKTIRELAGLPTGYKQSDLTSGRLIFIKIRRSKMALKLETAARLKAIEKGSTPQDQGLLLGYSEPEAKPEESTPVEPEPETFDESFDDFDPPPENKPASKRQELIDTLKIYLDHKIVPKAHEENATKVQEWLIKTENAEQNKTFWPKALGIIKSIQDAVDPSDKITLSFEGEL